MTAQLSYKWSADVLEQAYCILNYLVEELRKSNYSILRVYNKQYFLLANAASKECVYYNGLMWLKDNKLIVVYFLDESSNVKIKFTERGFFYFVQKYNNRNNDNTTNTGNKA